jgi:hypothetical protein
LHSRIILRFQTLSWFVGHKKATRKKGSDRKAKGKEEARPVGGTIELPNH